MFRFLHPRGLWPWSASAPPLRLGFFLPPPPGGGGTGLAQFFQRAPVAWVSYLVAAWPVRTRTRAIFLASRLWHPVLLPFGHSVWYGLSSSLSSRQGLASAGAWWSKFFWRPNALSGRPHLVAPACPVWVLFADQTPPNGAVAVPVRSCDLPPVCRFLSVRWGRRDPNRRV